ncbi:MAG TPA: NAD(P)/FAD-dependent oxidoreductase, partial [Acidimicrobiales bacterium]|nr:NAD(P)/FAD-dependent oxidoreductase [Acidimicrobiales bacterium]
MADPDAVVVGAGPNGLAAAIVLARNGVRVRLYEARSTVGGGARTEELTLPGFRHDPCSAVHPLAAGSPVLAALPLERYGLEWVHPTYALVHPRADGGPAVLSSSLAGTAEGLGADATRYRRLVGPFVERWDELAHDVLGPVTARLPTHPVLTARFGARAALPAGALVRGFRQPEARALLAGLAAHAICPLSWPGTGGAATIFAAAAHARGWPFPRGGTQALSDAMAAYLRTLGGEIVLDHPVGDVRELGPARAYLLDVSVPVLIRMAESRLPSGYVRRLRRFQHGPGVFKLDYALSGPMPWTEPAAREAGTVHIGASYEEIAEALRGVARGRAPERPFLIAAQPTVFDATRAPEGRHVLWVYGHAPYGWHG